MSVSPHADHSDQAAGQEVEIVLQPLTHPELGDIRVEGDLFAIGRSESPFDAYAPEIVSDLSRRHARIFCEYGAAYMADLGSKNGTTVNGVNVQQKITRLRDSDEICFARTLCYKVQLHARTAAPRRAARLASLALVPERDDAGLQPIVITRFPFLVSKTDETFARYRDSHPHQVNYISRRHAHIFIRNGQAFIEDLGSTNGTFVGGKRLDEHAVGLQEGDVLAFGGNHFVYKASLQQEEGAIDPTLTKLGHGPRHGSPAADADKTTFVASANSFLDIFCVDRAQQQEDEVNHEADEAAPEQSADKRKPRGKLALMASELLQAFDGNEAGMRARGMRWAGIAAGLVCMIGLALLLRGAPERHVKNLMAHGEYAQAAQAADTYLKRDPGSVELRTLGSEALLKAHVPQWWALLKAHQFDRANIVIAEMRRLARRNAEMQPLVSELEWIGDIERFVVARGGLDAAVGSKAEQQKIAQLIQQWEGDPQRHQRAFATISSYVPEFRDSYAEALSHLRKLALANGQKGETSHAERKPAEVTDGSVGGP